MKKNLTQEQQQSVQDILMFVYNHVEGPCFYESKAITREQAERIKDVLKSAIERIGATLS